MLADYFKEILETYNAEKTKPFKDNPLVFKIRNEIPNVLSKFLDDDVSVKAACGVRSWLDSPWVTIVSNSFDSQQEALILQYNFDCKNSAVTLSLIPHIKSRDECVYQ